MKEKTADEMFEELGYVYEKRKYADVYVKNKEDNVFVRQFGFNRITKNIMISVEYITKQELQAINKKCQELGWLDE